MEDFLDEPKTTAGLGEHTPEPKTGKTHHETSPKIDPATNSLPNPCATKRQSIAHREEFGLFIRYSSARI